MISPGRLSVHDTSSYNGVMNATVQVRARSGWARPLLLIWCVLIGYMSLYPFVGWRYQGVGLFAFMVGPWPRQLYLLDVILNIAGYVPLGVLLVVAFRWRARWHGLMLALGAGFGLSALMEGLQGFLPVRVSSSTDLVANAAGALAGGLIGGWLKPHLGPAGWFHRSRARWFRQGADIDLTLVLLLVWPLTQLLPGAQAFATGDFRSVLGEPTVTLHPAEVFVLVDALVAFGQVVVLGLLWQRVLAPGCSPALPLVALVALACFARLLALAWFTRGAPLPGLLTPGALGGLCAAGFALPWLARFHRLRLERVGLAVLLLVILVLNLAPLNPYLVDPVGGRYPVYESSLRALAALAAGLWPVLAVLVFLRLARRAGDRPIMPL